jgi:hypothetical protein
MLCSLYLDIDRAMRGCSCYLSSLALSEYLYGFLELGYNPAQVAKYPRDCGLRQEFEYPHLSAMNLSPSCRQVNIPIPLNEGPAKEVSPIQNDNELGPSVQISRLIGNLEGHVKSDFLPII